MDTKNAFSMYKNNRNKSQNAILLWNYGISKSWLGKEVNLVMRFEIKLQSYKNKLLWFQENIIDSISLFSYYVS